MAVSNKIAPAMALAGAVLLAGCVAPPLKPVSLVDYKVAFTPAEQGRLNAIFAAGVCDWAKPGVGQTKVVPWASFGPSPANLIFDITKQ